MIWRAATRADVAAIAALLAEDWRGVGAMDVEALAAGWDAMEASGATRAYVGGEAGEVIATYQLSILSGLSFTAATRAEIEAVRVRADRRGSGIGAALLADAEARAIAAGATLMQLTSNATRAEARRFYEREGYVPSHTGFKKPLAP